MPLPPLRVINHIIPLLDDNKVYPWRPLKCSEALKPLWRARWGDYIHAGRWEFQSGTNAVPMLMLKKPTKDGTLCLICRNIISTCVNLLHHFLVWKSYYTML